MKRLRNVDPEVAEIISKELNRQKTTIELIASESFTSRAVLEAQGSVLTNKYAEGYPGKRYYGGCHFVDKIEILAQERAKKLFKAEYANVQSHAGAQANMAAYFALIEVGDKVMGLDLTHGGHLTHGSGVNYSGKLYNFISYGVRRDTETLDYDKIRDLALKHKPKLILTGATAYPRIIDFKIFKEIADEIGACLLVDMAHIAGLIAAGIHPSPVPYSDIVTSTTHKTLKGPRAGLILCKEKYAKKVDKAVFPGIQGGPLMHVIAAKAVALKEAMSDSFVKLQKQCVKNAKVLAKAFQERGFRIVSGGTDNHLLLVDLTSKNINGLEAQEALDEVGITVNRNTIPFDQKSPFITSGIRVGTHAVSIRGMKESEMDIIAGMISRILNNIGRDGIYAEVEYEARELCRIFPLYEEIIY